MVFAARTHSFGEVERGTVVTHAFELFNRGGVDLSIDKLRPGCGCQATIDAERFIPPGGRGQIRLECNTDTRFGRQRRTVSVYSNDPDAPVTVLRLVGTVTSAAAIVPARLYLGRVHRGQRAAREATLYVRDAGGGADVMPAADAPFDVAVEPTQDPTRAIIRIVPLASAPLGPFTTHLRVYAGAARQPLQEVTVIGEVGADVGVSPARLSVAPDTRVTYLLVDNRGARPVRVTGATWPLGGADVQEVSPGTRYRIRLAPTQPFATASDSVITVRTDHPQQQVIEVPVVLSGGAAAP